MHSHILYIHLSIQEALEIGNMDEKSKKQTTVNDLTYFYKMTKSSEYVHLCVCVCARARVCMYTEKLQNDSLSYGLPLRVPLSGRKKRKSQKICKMYVTNQDYGEKLDLHNGAKLFT